MTSERALPPRNTDAYFVWVRGGNTGDDLIRQASLRFLRDAGLDVWESDGQIETAALRDDDAYLSEALGGFGGLLFFSGGGNIGIYPDNGYIRARVVAAARSARGMLVLPQSARAAESGLKSDRLIVWAREAASFDVLARAGVRTELVPDVAFYLDPTIPKIPGGSGVFQVLREPGRDDERVEHGLLIAGSERGDPTYDLDLQTIIDLLAPYRTIVSDRLHGAIIALMLRKRTALLPVGYHKVRSFYETWMRSDPGTAYVTNAQELEQFLAGDETPRLDLGSLFTAHAGPALKAFLNEASRRAARVAGFGETSPSIGPAHIQRLVAITCARNEADIVEAFIRHTLGFVDEMVVLDHDSTDDTNRILKALQDEGLPLILTSDKTVGYGQWSRMTRLMREVAARQPAADWVLPLDVDEFVVESQPGCLRRALAKATGPVHLRWTTYVPRPTDDQNDPNPVTRIRSRVSEEAAWYKVVVPRHLAEHERATLAQGSHDIELDNVACAAEPIGDAWLAHFPVRSGSQFAGKVAITQLQFLAMHRRDAGWGLHGRRFYDLLKADLARFHESHYDAALEYAPREPRSQPPSHVEERLYYAGGPLRYTSRNEPLVMPMLLDYAEQLAQSYATSAGELEAQRAQGEELARERLRLTQLETELRDRTCRYSQAIASLESRVRSSELACARLKQERAYRIASAARALWHLAVCSIRADPADVRHQLDTLRHVLRQKRPTAQHDL